MSVFNTVREIMVKNGSPTRGTRLRYSNPETGESVKVVLGGVSPDLSPESLVKTGENKGCTSKTVVNLPNTVGVDDEADLEGEAAGRLIRVLVDIPVPTETPVV